MLINKKIIKNIPDIYGQQDKGFMALAFIKFFTPDSFWAWYATEFDGKDIFFGLVMGFEIELGYFSLGELECIRGPLGLKVERDIFFSPARLKLIVDQVGRNSKI